MIYLIFNTLLTLSKSDLVKVMKTLGDIIRHFGTAYRKRFRPPPQHLKVLDAVRKCRTSALGGHAWVCTGCGNIHVHYNSCGNRHCPQCQAFEKEKWGEARKDELLPVSYLHLVFTLPHELNILILSNDRLFYNLLFKAVWTTVNKIAQDKRWLGAQTGMIAVLHTWGSNLSLHPHLHCIIPCGGLNKTATKWMHTRKKRFLAPNRKVLAPIFKAVFMRLLIRAVEEEKLEFYGKAKMYAEREKMTDLLQNVQTKNWNVFAKAPFAGPAQIINYLSLYTHRIALSNRRIVAVQDGKVSFTVKDYKHKNAKGLATIKTMTLCVFEFIRRFLMHVLPKGFQRIRYYGILAAVNRKTKLKAAQRLLGVQNRPKNPFDWKLKLKELTGLDPDVCSVCGQKKLILLGHIPDVHLSPGRSPPLQVIIYTPEGEIIPLTV